MSEPNTTGIKEFLICVFFVLTVPPFVWWWIPIMQESANYKKGCVLVAQMPTDEYTGVAARGTRQRLYVNVYECPDGKIKRLIESGPRDYK